MKKNKALTFILFAAASLTGAAQTWKPYAMQAQLETYRAADCITLLDSTDVSVASTGQGSFAVCRVFKVQNIKGALKNRILKYDYDPLTAAAKFRKVTVHHADGTETKVDVSRTCDYAAPARAIYWGARQIMLELGELRPGDIVDYEIEKKGFTYALLGNLPAEDDSRFIPPMRGQFYDIVPFWANQPTVRKVYQVKSPHGEGDAISVLSRNLCFFSSLHRQGKDLFICRKRTDAF